jgi:solute carrier family 25 carnitine/acylcarnitine transporter 20/29
MSLVPMSTELTAGGLAGAAGILATQPMDTIRIRLQSSSDRLGLQSRYTGILDCGAACVQREGMRGLYKGVASPFVTVGLVNAVLFLTFERAARTLRERRGLSAAEELSLPQVFLAGSTAGLTTAVITGPTELVKCIAQTDLRAKGLIREEWAVFQGLLRDHGIRGPCRGLGLTILREVPSLAVYFSTYEMLRHRLGKSKIASFFAGGFAGALGWAVIYPVDVLKTRWTTAEPGTYASVKHCLQDSVRKEGYGVFGKGFIATMARAWPQNAVIFLTYEYVKDFIAGRRPH